MNELPTSLAGWQALADDVFPKAGDLVVVNGVPEAFIAIDYKANTVGELRAAYGENINRRIPVAKPGDGDHKAKTYDDGKPPLANLPIAGLNAVAAVMEYGHQKYGDYNNFRKGMEVLRNLSCALRHIFKFIAGEDNDPESKLPHLWHAAARLFFVIQNQEDGTCIDNRYKKQQEPSNV